MGSTVIEKTCICGEKFTATIWTRPDGSHTSAYEKCQNCRQIDSHNERKEKAQAKLEEIAEDQMSRWQEDSNVPGKFLSKTFANFDKALQPKAFEATKNLQWFWDEALDVPAKSLVLLSPGVYGVGKTHLVCALVNQILETEDKATLREDLSISKHRCPVYLVSETELLRRIRRTFDGNSRETEGGIYHELSRFALLIIDDVGKVRPRDLNFLQSVYFGIINQRYNDQSPIVLTTNLDFADLEGYIGGANADRLVEMAGKGGFIKMTGKSYRGHKERN